MADLYGTPENGLAPLTAWQLQLYFNSGQGGTVHIDSLQYMQTYARHAVLTVSRLEDLKTAFNDGAGTRFTDAFAFRNYRTDIHSEDYFDRSFGYGTAGFDINGQIVEVNGELRFQGYITPQDDNFDFAFSNKGWLTEAVGIFAKAWTDTFFQGDTIYMNFVGPGQYVDLSYNDIFSESDPNSLFNQYTDVRTDDIASSPTAMLAFFDGLALLPGAPGSIAALTLTQKEIYLGTLLLYEFLEDVLINGEGASVNSLRFGDYVYFFEDTGASDIEGLWISADGSIADTQIRELVDAFHSLGRTIPSSPLDYLSPGFDVPGLEFDWSNISFSDAITVPLGDYTNPLPGIIIPTTNNTYQVQLFEAPSGLPGTIITNLVTNEFQVVTDNGNGTADYFFQQSNGIVTRAQYQSSEPQAPVDGLPYMFDPEAATLNWFESTYQPTNTIIMNGTLVTAASGQEVLVTRSLVPDSHDGTLTLDPETGEPIGEWQTTVKPVARTVATRQLHLLQPLPDATHDDYIDITRDGYNIGQAFGSSIGRVIAGDNLFAQVAAGSVLGAVLGNLGESVGRFFDPDAVGQGYGDFDEAVYESFDNFNNDLGAGVRGAGIGLASSFLAAELAESIGIDGDGFGTQLFEFTASSAIGSVLDIALDTVGLAAGVPADATSLLSGLFYGSGAGAASSGLSLFNPMGVAGFIGTYIGGTLGREIVEAENIGGVIGGSIGQALGGAIGAGSFIMGSVGTAIAGALGIASGTFASSALTLALGVVLPGIGALIGVVLGTVLGNAIGGWFEDHGYGNYGVSISAGETAFENSTEQTNDWDFGEPPYRMRNQTRDVINSFMAAIGGTVADNSGLSIIFKNHKARSYQYMRVNVGSAQLDTYDQNALVHFAVIQGLKQLTIDGGNEYMLDAIQQSTTSNLQLFARQLEMAQGFGNFLEATFEMIGGEVVSIATADFNQSLADSDAVEAAIKAQVFRVLLGDDNTAAAVFEGAYSYMAHTLANSTATTFDQLFLELGAAHSFGVRLRNFADGMDADIGFLPATDFTVGITSEEEAQAAADAALYDFLKNGRIDGGDIYVKRALTNSTATTLDGLQGDIIIARDFSNYMANKAVIDAIIELDPESAFAAGWVITLAKASELGLDDMAASDFNGGMAYFLETYNFERFGVGLADLTFSIEETIREDNSLRYDLVITYPGVENGDEPRRLVIEDYQTLTGLTPSDAATPGDDLWFGEAGVREVFDYTPPIDGNINDIVSAELLIGSDAGDTLNGGGGADTIYGGAGDDTIDGGSGRNVIVGGQGNDIIGAGEDNDVFAFARGDGEDTITDAGGVDIIDFGQGIDESHIAVRLDGDDLIIAIFDPDQPDQAFDDVTDKIRVVDWQLDGSRVEYLRFANGLVLSAADLVGMLATDGDDVISYPEYAIAIETLDGNDQVTGGDGDDFVDGGAGQDVITLNGGHDYIIGGADNDTISAGEGNDIVDASVGSDIVDGGSGNDTIVYSGALAGVTIDLEASLATEHDDGLSGEQTDEIANFENAIGSDYNDTIIGNEADNIIGGGAGDDTLNGGKGADSYLYGRGDSADTIYDTYTVAAHSYQEAYTYYVQEYVEGGEDGYYRQVARTGYRTVNVPEAVHDGGAGDVLRFGAGITINDLVFEIVGNDLIIGVLPEDFDPADPLPAASSLDDQVRLTDQAINNTIEHLAFENGMVVISIDVDANGYRTVTATDEGGNLIGSERAENLIGGIGDDVVFGLGGDDDLQGGSGDDVYLYSRGGGADVITDISGADTLRFDSGITLDDLVFELIGDNLIIGLLPEDFDPANPLPSASALDDKIEIVNQGIFNAVDTFLFADGTELTSIDVSDDGVTRITFADGRYFIRGTESSDDIAGSQAADLIEGRAGNDVINGGLGADTYLFGRGDGADTVSDIHTEPGYSYQQSYTYYVNVWVSGGGEEDGYYRREARTGYRTVDVAAVTHDGGAGDVLRFGAAIAINDLVFEIDGNDLIIGILPEDFDQAAPLPAASSLDDQVRLIDQVINNTIEHLAFENGMVVISIDVDANGYRTVTATDEGGNLIGSERAEKLIGGSGNDVIYGLGGDDDLHGGDGDDTYIFSRGDGADTLSDTGGVDALHFGTGISRDDLVIEWDGADLIIGILPADHSIEDTMPAASELSDRIRLIGPVDPSLIDRIVFSDGSEATVAELLPNGGDDDYVVARGDRSTTIADPAGDDALKFGPGIELDDLVFELDGNDLLIGIRPDGWETHSTPQSLADLLDVVRIVGWVQEASRIESIALDDGTIIGMLEVLWRADPIGTATININDEDVLRVTGTTNHDVINSGVGLEIISAGAGYDHIVGNGAAKLIDGGDGYDRVDYSGLELDSNGRGVDVNLRTGIGAKSVGEADRLFNIEFVTGTEGDDVLLGDDGDNQLFGGTGADTLRGGGGTDTLSGGAGNDVMSGGAGNDSYAFHIGAGQDTIENSDDGSGWDVLSVYPGITEYDLWFARVGNDLSMTMRGYDDSVTFTNWYTDDGAQIDRFNLLYLGEGGSAYLDAGRVDALVNAMAAYSPDVGVDPSSNGVHVLPPDVELAINAQYTKQISGGRG